MAARLYFNPNTGVRKRMEKTALEGASQILIFIKTF
jgi:hypothetical protein